MLCKIADLVSVHVKAFQNDMVQILLVWTMRHILKHSHDQMGLKQMFF